MSMQALTSPRRFGILFVFLLLIGGKLQAEIFQLTPARLSDLKQVMSGYSLDYWQVGGTVGTAPDVSDSTSPELDQYLDMVNQEPAYESKYPIRSLLRFAGETYAFSLDAVNQEASGTEDTDTPFRVTNYNRLYLDKNQNGDLTDDESYPGAPIENTRPNRAEYSFYGIRIPVKIGGEEFDYMLSATAIASRLKNENIEAGGSKWRYQGNTTFRPDIVREGLIELDGKQHRVFLADINGNGRFDDMMTIRRNQTTFPVSGDQLLVDPDPKVKSEWYSAQTNGRHILSPTIKLDDKLYDLSVSPSGSSITLTLLDLPLGTIRPDCDDFSMVLANPKYGTLSISGDEEDEIPLPAGEWQVIVYHIEKASGESESSDSALSRSYLSVRGFYGGVSDPLVVEEGECLELPFSQPLAARLQVSQANSTYGEVPAFPPPFSYAPGSNLQFDLSVNDIAGNNVFALITDGAQPERPKFRILTPLGVEVAHGEFEYG